MRRHLRQFLSDLRVAWRDPTSPATPQLRDYPIRRSP
jgi:hypothetical protein